MKRSHFQSRNQSLQSSVEACWGLRALVSRLSHFSKQREVQPRSQALSPLHSYQGEPGDGLRELLFLFFFIPATPVQRSNQLSYRIHLSSYNQSSWILQGSYKTWKSLKVLEFENKIQGLECPGICKEVLESPWILLALLYGYFLKLFDIQKRTFCWIDFTWSYIWQSCLKFTKVAFLTIQRVIVLISNAFSVFSAWICWYMVLNVLDKSLNLTLSDHS